MGPSQPASVSLGCVWGSALLGLYRKPPRGYIKVVRQFFPATNTSGKVTLVPLGDSERACPPRKPFCDFLNMGVPTGKKSFRDAKSSILQRKSGGIVGLKEEETVVHRESQKFMDI